MTNTFVNIAKMTTATTGTGTITLGSAVSGYLSFATAGITNGQTVSYTIVDGTDKEVGTGTYTSSGTTLSRSLTISTTGSLLNLSGSATVEVVLQASDINIANLPGYSTSTFTPGIAFGGATTGITYTEQLGRYIKIGKLVAVWIDMIISSYGSATGNMTITGLPFTSANPSATWGYAVTVGLMQGSTFLPSAWVGPNSTVINLWKPSAQTQVGKADVAGAGTEIIVTAVYESAT